MKHINDPFPPTPERFHHRVEATLQSLEEKDMKHAALYGKTAVLIAAIVAALLAVTAVAAVVGHSHFKDKLNARGVGEVAELVQEAHLTGGGAKEGGFAFSIDEIIWEDHDLYISYSMAVPEDGGYMVAMYTPTINGEKLVYDAKGWTSPKFIDPEDGAPAVLLLGGEHSRECNELWTFAADPRLKQRTDNRLDFRAVLLKTDLDFKVGGDWTDMLNPPDYLQFTRDWRDLASAREIGIPGADCAAMMDAMGAALGDGLLTVDELIATGHAEYVTEQVIQMGLDGTQMSEILYNDVAEHDFERFGMHIHVNRFRMTHLGVEIDITYYKPGAAKADREVIQALDAFERQILRWRFCTVDGKSPGYSLGGEGGGGRSTLKDGAPACDFTWKESAILPLKGLDQIAFAPCEYVDDEDGGNHPVYDMENAIVLTPLYSQAVAEMELNATPEPTLTPEELEYREEADLSN